MNKLEKAYIYTRVSTEMQVEGFSLTAQKEDICRYAKARGLQIVGEFCDEGKSGKSDKRPEFMKMLSKIKTNEDGVRYVLVFKLSRFARNAADTLKNLQLMQDHGVDLICIKEGLDSSTAVGKLMVTVMSAVAEMELENIHTQTMAGRKQKAKEGKWNGGFAPYGYTLEGGNLKVVENEATTVRYIFKLFTEDNLGPMKVSKRLNAEGIKKVVRQNGKYDVFTTDFIKDILDNPVYMGKIAYGRRKTEKVNGEHGKTRVVKQKDESNIILVDGIHEAIVSEEVWNTAHSKRLEMGTKKEKLEQEHQYVLSGLVKCPSCGRSLYGVPNRKKKADGTYYKVSYAYKCRQSKSTTGVPCSLSRQYNCDDIDSEFASFLMTFLLTPAMIDTMLERLNVEYDVSELENNLKSYEERKRELINKQHRLEDEQLSLNSDDKHYDRKYESKTRQLETIFEQLDEIDQLIYDTKGKINNSVASKKERSDAIWFLTMLSVDFELLSPIAKKRYAEMVVDSIELFPSKRDAGYIKSVRFKVPVFQKQDELTNIITVWDKYPDILDEEGNFNGYCPEDDLPDRDMLAERADENGYIPVVEDIEIEAEEIIVDDSVFEMKFESFNTFRRKNGFPELTEEDFLALCRPKQITDETVVCLNKQ